MKFTTNGKRLKEMINLCLLKGKYNQGITNTKGQMGNCVKITGEPNAILVENGDASTYVRVSKTIREGENDGSFHAFVNADTLSKYLVDEESAFIFSEGNVRVLTGNSVWRYQPLKDTNTPMLLLGFPLQCRKSLKSPLVFLLRKNWFWKLEFVLT